VTDQWGDGCMGVGGREEMGSEGGIEGERLF
jgi:hypothetical protein